jgi:hypothetical protein
MQVQHVTGSGQPTVTENYSNRLATVRGQGGTYFIRYGFMSGNFIVVSSALDISAVLCASYDEALSTARTLAQ